VTSECRESEGSMEPQLGGFVPSEPVYSGQQAPGRSTFLLDPGGQDYVGRNSYDDIRRIDE
jgi:hypothetical protein